MVSGVHCKRVAVVTHFNRKECEMNKKTKAAPRGKKLTPAKKLSTVKPLTKLGGG